MSGQADERVRVRFVTHYVQFRVTDEPFAVPISFARYALSEVVNHLLDLDTPQPFDFLVTVNDNQRLLRTTLHKFIQANGISKEDVVEIEYMPAVTLSEDTNETEADAWIGSVDARTIPDAIVTGGYDGVIRVFDHDLQQTSTLSVHDVAIRCLAMTSDGDNAFIYTGSKDHGIVCTRYSDDSCRQLATLSAHQSSVESLCVGFEQGAAQKLYSGDWEGGVCIWDLASLQGAAQNDLPRSKRQRAAKESAESADRITAEPQALFKAHTQATSGVGCNDDNTTLYTASFDHSIKVWDIETQNTVMTFNGSKVVTSLSYNSALNLIATSHPDGKVRVWDPRAGNDNASVVKTSLAHNGQWVSSVKWAVNNPAPLLASSDYDGVVRLWDMRGSVALAAQQAHDGKALCVDWVADRKIVSGGSDCVLRIASLTGKEEQS